MRQRILKVTTNGSHFFFYVQSVCDKMTPSGEVKYHQVNIIAKRSIINMLKRFT